MDRITAAPINLIPRRRRLVLAAALLAIFATAAGTSVPVSGESPVAVSTVRAAALEPTITPTLDAAYRSAAPLTATDAIVDGFANPVAVAPTNVRLAATTVTPRSTSLVVGINPAPGATVTTTTSNIYKKDVYFKAGYERQVDGRTCSAASTAMMMNFIARKDLRLRQMSILRYEQPRDALNDAVQRGSDALGWSKAATYYSKYTSHPTTYTWQAYGSKSAAINAAAKAIAKYGKPVGIVAWNGKHAIVMTGFESIGNPATGSFKLRYIWTSDPYWSGPTVGSHRKWTPGNFAFGAYRETDATAKYDKLWIGKYIIIAPTN